MLLCMKLERNIKQSSEDISCFRSRRAIRYDNEISTVYSDNLNLETKILKNHKTSVLNITYTNQSTANNRVTSCTGASIAVSTTSNKTNAALGTEAELIEAAVDVSKTVTNSPKPKVIPLIWAINIEATEMKRAVPSILMLQPIGRTKRVIR
uniref:Uncharacterized protein n=1 Tax=Glossina palpalis gambiensis TaxID=67801 RepID=A0A1B0C4R5_9MUSC